MLFSWFGLSLAILPNVYLVLISHAHKFTAMFLLYKIFAYVIKHKTPLALLGSGCLGEHRGLSPWLCGSAYAHKLFVVLDDIILYHFILADFQANSYFTKLN
jgi:hypothetical protein